MCFLAHFESSNVLLPSMFIQYKLNVLYNVLFVVLKLFFFLDLGFLSHTNLFLIIIRCYWTHLIIVLIYYALQFKC